MSAISKPITPRMRQTLHRVATIAADGIGVPVEAILMPPSAAVDVTPEKRLLAVRVACDLARTVTSVKPNGIGTVFGGRSSAAVRSAGRALRREMARNPEVKQLAHALFAQWHETQRALSGRHQPREKTLLDVVGMSVRHALEAGLEPQLRELLAKMLPPPEGR